MTTNYKITEPLVPGGLGGARTRSRVVAVEEGGQVPSSAAPTEEDARDWLIDVVSASATQSTETK